MNVRLQPVVMACCLSVFLTSTPASAQTRNLTVAVLVNSQRVSGYNPNPASPGGFQRFAERYLEHLQVPYQLFDVATTAPPADLNARQRLDERHH
jgi:hypothetical protein